MTTRALILTILMVSPFAQATESSPFSCRGDLSNGFLPPVEDYAMVWNDYEPEDNSQAITGMARNFILSALLTVSKAELRIPRGLVFEMVTRPSCLPTYCPFGYDFSTGDFWGLVQPDQISTDLAVMAIEYGKYLFRQNLLFWNSDFRKWELEKNARLMQMPTLERLREHQQFKVQTTLTKNYGYPWDRLVHDYETAFGVLFAAISADSHNPELKDFFDHEIYSGVDLLLDGEVPVLPRNLIFDKKPITPVRDPREEDPYLTDLRPAIKWIWTNFLNEKSVEDRATALNKIFFAFNAEIARRHFDEPEKLILDSVMNYNVIARLPPPYRGR